MSVIALILCTGLATADTGVPQVPETQGFVTSTAMSAVGTVTETDSIVNIIANYADELSGPVPHPILGHTNGAEYTASYREETLADQGLVTYTKGMTTETSGAATTGMYNAQTSKVVEFLGSDTGRMISDEASVLDGAGTAFFDEDILICPFAAPTLVGRVTFNPVFCNIVQEGSALDLTRGSLATDTGQRYIMERRPGEGGLDFPVSDPGVEADYGITLTGLGDLPAVGSAQASIDVHVQEGRDYIVYHDQVPLFNLKSEDLAYTETSTANGEITLFRKVMNYNSKITEPGQNVGLG